MGALTITHVENETNEKGAHVTTIILNFLINWKHASATVHKLILYLSITWGVHRVCLFMVAINRNVLLKGSVWF